MRVRSSQGRGGSGLPRPRDGTDRAHGRRILECAGREHLAVPLGPGAHVGKTPELQGRWTSQGAAREPGDGLGPGPAGDGGGRRTSQLLSGAVKAERPNRSCWIFTVSASEGGAGCQGLGVLTAMAGALCFAGTACG